MIAKRAKAIGSAVLVAGLVGLPGAASAGDDGTYVTRDEIKSLYDAVAAQKSRLTEQERQIAEQARVLESQAREIAALKQARTVAGAAEGAIPASYVGATGPDGTQARPAASSTGKKVAQTDDEKANSDQNGKPAAKQQPVGEAPKQQEEAPSVAIASDVSVLTKEGQLSIEPSLEFSNSTVNRFSFSGLEIVDTILIGLIEATQASRDTYTASLGLRYGVFNRFEVDARIPYIYRNDRVTNRIVSLNVEQEDQLEGNGIGDAELAVHYQVNGGRDGWPFFVGNLKYKFDNGEGPFDLEADANGVLDSLPTGSGFPAVQPSVTVIFPTDPAVLFANVGYIYSFSEDIDRTFGTNTIGTVDPGDTIAISFGMGISLNDLTSISFGYEHNFISGTTQEINGREVESDDLQVGSLLVGFSYRALDYMNLNLNVAVGVTDESPDIRLVLRTPLSFQLF